MPTVAISEPRMYIRRTESKGTTYYRVVENRWIDGKPVQVNVVSLGTCSTVEDALKWRQRRARYIRKDLDWFRSVFRGEAGLALASAKKRRQMESKEAALEKIEAEIATLKRISADVPPFGEKRDLPAPAGPLFDLEPTASTLLPLPDMEAVEAIRAQLAPDLLARFDEEVEAYIDDAHRLNRLDEEDHCETVREMERSLLDCLLIGGAPDTAVPCPDCKDDQGKSVGWVGSPDSRWRDRCGRCRGHGYTGFGIAIEARANCDGLPS